MDSTTNLSSASSATWWLFDERFWLSENVTWDDFKNNDGPEDGHEMYKAQGADLWRIVPAAIALFVIRQAFERWIAAPLGKHYGISEKTVKAAPNVALESLYKKSMYPSHEQLQASSKQTDLSEKQIQRWLRRRRNQDRPTGMVKFTETAWRFFFYLTIFIYGLVVLCQKSWFWDVKDCWRGHPQQHVDPEIFWYYIIEMGFYLSLLFSQFGDVQRKDFWEQFIHHIATIILLSFSWTLNFVRIGSLVLCLHDAADYLLEGAKLARYMEMRTLCDVLFGTFTLCWAVTRLAMYPCILLWTSGVDCMNIVGPSGAIYLLNALLWLLQVLHVFWFVLIMNVLIKALKHGKVDKDVRSASEESGDEATTNHPVGTNSNGVVKPPQ